MKFVSDCLTGKDNLTYDAGRVIGVLGALMYVLFWVVQVVATWRFTPATRTPTDAGSEWCCWRWPGRWHSSRIRSPNEMMSWDALGDHGGGADGIHRAQRRDAALAVRAA